MRVSGEPRCFRYMLRRYWPPTSNSALVICPSEHTRTVFISSAKTLPFSITTCFSCASAAGASPACRCVEIGQPLRAATRFSSSVERASSIVCGVVVGVRIAEGVDADDRVAAVVLPVLVEQRLFLDLAALVAGLHRAQHAAALGDRLELLQHRLLDEVGQLLDDEAALVRVLVLRRGPIRG